MYSRPARDGNGCQFRGDGAAHQLRDELRCIGSYPGDTQVKLKATADAGSVFAGWAAPVPARDCDLVMNANKTVALVRNKHLNDFNTGRAGG